MISRPDSQKRGNGFSRKWIIAAGVWFVCVVFAMARVIDYTNTNGISAAAPLRWPVESTIERSHTTPTLLLFAHPHCPCTRATIGELNRLLSDCQQSARAYVIFTHPAGTPEDWSNTDLWRSAAAIPGVTVLRDDDNEESQRFRAETSGDTMLYDRNGQLLFEGGITLSRGHSGDNPGRGSLTAFLRGGIHGSARTPVFGCPIRERDCDGNQPGRETVN